MRRIFKDYFSRDRKTLYMVLTILLVSAFTLTVVYAALSTTLNISGNAEVSAASWDIYLDNVQLNSSSATTSVPTISNKTTVSFSTTLSKPGDFYEFTIDVVNNGSIDAMIDSVTKTPALTTTQVKYLNYIVEYQNGESINTKQLVEKESFVRLKVKVEFRKDITASDLPTTSEILDLAFTVNYVQSDDSDENITVDNNGKLMKIVSGDGTQVGDEICIGQECFYVISSDETSVTMLSKMNITTETTPKQSSSAQKPKFADRGYWKIDAENINSEYGTGYPAYVYDNNSIYYNYIESYKVYLESQGAAVEEARLIKLEELEELGCDRDTKKCEETPEWVFGTQYYCSGTAMDYISLYGVRSTGGLFQPIYHNGDIYGIRPVITIPKEGASNGTKKLIEFTISDNYSYDGYDFTNTYHAEEGMTWEEWVESEYNIDEYYINNSLVFKGVRFSVRYNGISVSSTDLIVPAKSYSLEETTSND